MSSNLSPFRIEVYNAQGEKIGGGPIGTVLSVNNTVRLDTIGNLEFTLPASDNWSDLITTGTQFDVYDEVDGYLGRFLFKSKSIQDQSGRAILRVDCYDKLKELTFETVGFFRGYNSEPVSTALSEIIALVSGWSVETSVTNNTTIDFQGESVFRAIDMLRDRFGYHFRLKNDGSQTLEFGPFGTLLSDIQFNQFNGQIQSDWLRNPNNALVSGISIVEESDEIFNKIIPLGFGQGVSQLTIEEATLGDYIVQSELNDDGSTRYYISDAASINDYGKRTRILQFPNIRPISNSDANLVNAANALKLTAEAYIKKHLAPRKEYRVDVKHLRQPVTVGDKIRIKYNQEWNGVNYISLDDEFYVMDITYNRNSNGNRTYSLNIANVDDRRTSNEDVIIDVVRDLKDIGVHIPATLAYAPIGPYTKRIKGDSSEVGRINPVFTARIRDEVLYLNRALLRFSTDSLKASSTGAAHNHLMFAEPAAYTGTPTTTPGTTVCADSPGTGGLINVVLDFYSLPSTPLYTFQSGQTGSDSIEYGVFSDNEYPRTIGLKINGTDRTTELGGYWATSENQIDIELDVTDILINDGIRRNHTFEFFCFTGRGEIEFECDMLVTIQPIRSYS